MSIAFDFLPSSEFPEWIEVCRLTGVHRFIKAKTRDYEDRYFLEEYKNQYNKTYYEDEANLRKLANSRLDSLIQVMGWRSDDLKNKSLLEIGSATGFFLDEARKRGFQVEGIEISNEGYRYSTDVLKLSVFKGGLLDFNSSEKKWDVVASFFTLEHIPEIMEIWIKISSLLRKGGGLILALPSFYGPTFQTNPKQWFETHPSDHFFDYDHRSLKKVLNCLDLHLKLKKPLSHHPDRDKGWKGYLPNPGYKWISDVLCYGDTFQIIAEKK
ncbi:class I SAM-dependent methyltransferase [Leptospira sp. GIMC2001]|uniref:class I SAM-dependent methyltransferase n=1 Tax=Leptospira sp. GIMC2001 TaxID=1513297 RepID=UPI002349102E|nr:class I SAM-dependent methyltransferase [Leptospira sp. GIMC2001]WCL51366.1 class I SAM-dependent methyltransferase [Leptospira sp. GIMC2001]